MSHPETSFAKAERHVRKAEKHLRHQVSVVADLEREGDAHAVESARQVLVTLQRNLELARDRVRAERVTHHSAR